MMKQKKKRVLLDNIRAVHLAVLLIFTLLLSACATPSSASAPVAAALENEPSQIIQDNAESEENLEGGQNDSAEENENEQSQKPGNPQLATASAVSQLSNQPGRAIVSARGNHFVVDSVPPIDGPNEELNPLDMMLSSLATCGIFVAEKSAQELNIPLVSAAALVEGDFDPRGVAGVRRVQTPEDELWMSNTAQGRIINPRIQAFRVYMELPGADQDQQAALIENFTRRCPIYTTLSRSAPVEIFTDGQTAGEKIEGLATASAYAKLSNQPGRAIVSARGNHFVIDSVPPLQGPNEERNPLDLMLGALATCGTFIYERVAEEENIPMTAIEVAVEGDFDPRGVAGEPVDPRLQAIRVNVELEGVGPADANQMRFSFQERCPVYTTLSRAVPIDITTER